MCILGFDPGKDKCGIAVMKDAQRILFRQVVESDKAIAMVKSLKEKYKIDKIVMGDQTTSKKWQQKLQENLSPDTPIMRIDERHSSLEARDLYWQLSPVKGLKKLIPQGLRLPPCPIDDLVAVILVRRYLA
jgi:RNase H-fold protein (predicted Holliday junction resolvase)